MSGIEYIVYKRVETYWTEKLKNDPLNYQKELKNEWN